MCRDSDTDDAGLASAFKRRKSITPIDSDFLDIQRNTPFDIARRLALVARMRCRICVAVLGPGGFCLAVFSRR